MHTVDSLPALNGQASAVQILTEQQRRALRAPLRALSAAIRDLAPSKPPQSKCRRLLFRSPCSLSDHDLDRIVAAVGIERMWDALQRVAQPPRRLIVGEVNQPSIQQRS
jgi:hypothetical protein